MKRRFQNLAKCLLLLAWLPLAGCLEYSQELHFHSDSTLTVQYAFRYRDQDERTIRTVIAFLQKRFAELPPEAAPSKTEEAPSLDPKFHELTEAIQRLRNRTEIPKIPFDKIPKAHAFLFLEEPAVQEYFRRENVDLRLYRKTRKDGWTTVEIIVLARKPAEALASGLFGPFTFEKNDGHTTVTLPMPATELALSPENPIAWFAKELTARFSVTAPLPILQTNGTLEDKTASWNLPFDGEPSLLHPPRELRVQW
ncbi:MAG: hypothetical protein IJJ26_07895 [Victivallales bacterium]|nr:hypothetical protein [Victivallales bacterium]